MENTQPLISFIIPVYNVPVTMLCECIDSLLALSLRPFEREIIVIDDGSDPAIWSPPSIGAGPVPAQNAGPVPSLGTRADHIIYVRQKNAGVSAARNRGLLLATGRFIQFIDGDDMLLQAPYEHVLDQLRYQQCDMVLFDFATLHQPQPTARPKDACTARTLNPQISTQYDDHGPMTGSELLRRENIHGSVWSYTFSRSILGSLRFTPGVAYGEDEEFTPQLLLRAERALRTTAQAYCYRERTTSATGSTSVRSHIRRLEDTRAVIVRLKKMADRMPTADRIAMQRRTAQLTMDYLYNIIVITRSSHYLERKVKELSRAGLFPLPDRDYTTKYTWFRRMTNSRVGRAVLIATLPLMERER